MAQSRCKKDATLDGSILTDETATLDGKTSVYNNIHQLFKGSTFTNVTLIVGDKRFPAHKLILAASSTFFQRMFFGGSWMEGSSNEVKMEDTPSCEEVFDVFLSYFYSGCVTVSNKTVIPVVTLADKYDVQGLREMCTEYMVSSLNNKCDVEAALRWITFAEQMRMDALQQKCFDLICVNFDKAYNLSSWQSLSLEQLLTVLERSDIVVSNEYTVFQAVQTWLLGNSCTQSEVEQVMSLVQFKNMTLEQLCQVDKSELASNDVCKSTNLLAPYLKDGFTYVAVEHGMSGRNIEPANLQRWYTTTWPKNYENAVNLNDKSHELKPTCTLTDEVKHYTWKLQRRDYHGDRKYQIRLQNVSRQVKVYNNDYQFGRSTYIQLLYLPDSKFLSGDIRLKLVVVIRGKDGRAFQLRGSFVTRITREDNQVLCEFPDECPDLIPRKVYYTF